MTNDNIQHGIDDNPTGDAEKGAKLGGVGGAVFPRWTPLPHSTTALQTVVVRTRRRNLFASGVSESMRFVR